MSIDIMLTIDDSTIKLYSYNGTFTEQFTNRFEVDTYTNTVVSIGQSKQYIKRKTIKTSSDIEQITFYKFLENNEDSILYSGIILKFLCDYYIKATNVSLISQLIQPISLHIDSTLWSDLTIKHKKELIYLLQQHIRLKHVFINGIEIPLSWTAKVSPETIRINFYICLGYTICFLSFKNTPFVEDCKLKYILQFKLGFIFCGLFLYHALRWFLLRTYLGVQHKRSISEIFTIQNYTPNFFFFFIAFLLIGVPALIHFDFCTQSQIIPFALCGLMFSLFFEMNPISTGRLYKNDVRFPLWHKLRKAMV